MALFVSQFNPALIFDNYAACNVKNYCFRQAYSQGQFYNNDLRLSRVIRLMTPQELICKITI